jgi:DNA-binding response OmpR family regulator
MAKRKVLVVDDDADLRRGLQIRLHAAGYDVALAADAVGAVSAAQRERPDAIILDIGLPGGDGFRVIERLKSLLPLAPIPVIILTGRDPAEAEQRMRDLGAEAFFQKPPDNEALVAAIRKALGG